MKFKKHRCQSLVFDKITKKKRRCKRLTEKKYCFMHSYNLDYGYCCFCNNPCNPCSQSCGSCIRNLWKSIFI